ncbi:Calx-beta domain-containing protein, partial [Motiliproteus sp. MSK22-1]|uniref:Calx-beta domain-containing protein n=1 Tax=Motiliproteus sp. MSK22-1 TaxID=1897630 RepID=UPI0026F45154
MSFPRKFSVARYLWVAMISRLNSDPGLAASTECVVKSQIVSTALKILPTTIISTLLLFWAATVQANVSFSAAPIQQPSNPVTVGTEVAYGLEAVADGAGASQIDIFINVNGVNQSAQFTSQTSECTLNGNFFTCGSRLPGESGGAVFSWDAPAGTSNIEFELFCLHSDQTTCSGDSTSISTEAAEAQPGELNISETGVTVNEEDGTATVTVTRSAGTSGAASVEFSTADGSAVDGSDYAATSGTLSWADGETGPKSIQITIVDDSVDEPDESFTVNLSNPVGASLGTSTTATVTIDDNDDAAGTLQISSIPGSAGEGEGSFTVSVSREGGSEGAAQVSITTAGSAVAGSDYSTDTTLLSWADGESGVKNLVVTLVDDTEVEGDETLEIQLSNVQGADLGSPASGTITIQDNENNPGSVQFDAAAVSVNESDGTATLSVNRTGSSGAASVDVSVTGGSAAGGEDYDFSGTTLSWANGESGSKSFTVSLTNDDSAEENETLTLNLSNPSDGLSVGAISSSTLTIQDDDSGLNPIEEAMKGIANGDPQREAVAQSIATICPQGVAETQLQNDCNALVGSALSDDGNVNA